MSFKFPYIYTTLLLTGLPVILTGSALTGCNSQDEPAGGNEATEENSKPNATPPTWTAITDTNCDVAPEWKATYPMGTDAAPEWNLPDLSVYATSMASVIALPDHLEAFSSADDVMGAFIGGECRALAKPDLTTGRSLYFLVVKAADDETRAVEFRYYSARLRRVYKADNAVGYTINGSYGNLTRPAEPGFENGLRLRGCVVIPTALVGYSNALDCLGVFVGDECRAIGTLTNNGTYAIDAFMQPGESFTLRYFSQGLRYLFESNCDTMTPGRELGSQANPYRMDFGVDKCRPLLVEMTLRLPEDMEAVAEGHDRIGVFVGDECRGVGEYESPTRLCVRAAVTGESYVVRYYNAAAGVCYRSREPLPMPLKDAGTTDEPLVPELVKE